jgi:hypothetical protein
MSETISQTASRRVSRAVAQAVPGTRSRQCQVVISPCRSGRERVLQLLVRHLILSSKGTEDLDGCGWLSHASAPLTLADPRCLVCAQVDRVCGERTRVCSRGQGGKERAMERRRGEVKHILMPHITPLCGRPARASCLTAASAAYALDTMPGAARSHGTAPSGDSRAAPAGNPAHRGEMVVLVLEAAMAGSTASAGVMK